MLTPALHFGHMKTCTPRKQFSLYSNGHGDSESSVAPCKVVMEDERGAVHIHSLLDDGRAVVSSIIRAFLSPPSAELPFRAGLLAKAGNCGHLLEFCKELQVQDSWQEKLS